MHFQPDVFAVFLVFLAAEAWRRRFGHAVRHAALQDGGGAILQYNREGMDPYPLVGWKKINTGEEGCHHYEGPNGEVCEDLQQAFEMELATKHIANSVDSTKVHLSVLQQFLNDCCSEKETRQEGEQRYVVTTSTLEDYLFRGGHPIVASMSLQVYAMWIFRVEKGHRNPDQKPSMRFIDIPFAGHYSLHGTHVQRLATEFRVPLFEGFTMPSQDVCSETAALFKQLLLRPLSVSLSDEPADIQLVNAFAPICDQGDGATAFGRCWLEFARGQRERAFAARLRFLERYEIPSIWETAEVIETLHDMYLQMLSLDAQAGEEGELGVDIPEVHDLDPAWCPDKGKPRATVEHYAALIGEDVAANLEGLARARMEKRPRQYQSDAAIHQAYIRSTTGGGETRDGEDPEEAEPASEGPQGATKFFEPLPWGITTEEEMEKILRFGHRVRLTAFAKQLLELPCMQPDALAEVSQSRQVATRAGEWRERYASIAAADVDDLVGLLQLQTSRLDPNHDDAELDVDSVPAVQDAATSSAPEAATFSTQDVYRTPSAYIAALVADLPAKERLTRDQSLFMARFAQCCDAAWEDEGKPPSERRVHHILLLGQGGSGKTHVVQRLVFKAVLFIWPSDAGQTLMVVAASNAQAKNISTAETKARTIHNASGMRVQKLTNDMMRPGKKQASLTKTWDHVRVLVIEACSMVAAVWYNMLDVRAMHGRSRTYDVCEATYKKPQHHFGRIPIVIHLGDFLQLSPTANISLVQDVNEKDEDGNYKFPEPPSLEVQHAIKVFGSIPHVFELRGTKRFKAGDPLIQFLGCMRAGSRIPDRIWRQFEHTFATDQTGTLDPRHRSEKFLKGKGLAMYWETLSRWISQRAKRDARELGVPLVFLQAVDECNTIDREAAQRLLNVPNMHNTGNIHGVLPAHVAMRVRFVIKVNSRLGLVQDVAKPVK